MDVGGAGGGFFVGVGGVGATRAERTRQDHRALRSEAMRAMRQIFASLYASIAPSNVGGGGAGVSAGIVAKSVASTSVDEHDIASPDVSRSGKKLLEQVGEGDGQQQQQPAPSRSLVEIHGSKRRRREEFEKAVLKYNQKPSAGIAYATKVGILNGSDPSSVAEFLLMNKDVLDKTQTGEYLGREPNYQEGFALKVLHNYANQMDFSGLRFDEGIKFYLSGFRLPGEAQKVSLPVGKFHTGSAWLWR